MRRRHCELDMVPKEGSEPVRGRSDYYEVYVRVESNKARVDKDEMADGGIAES